MIPKRTATYALLLLTSGMFAGCAGASPDTAEAAMAIDSTAIQDIDAAAWETLASRRIFFGHQSVGRNILAGMQRVLERHPEVSLRLASAEDPREVQGPAFVEANIGRNGHPDSKSDAFANVLASGFGSQPGAIGMYKFCYVDVNADTDAEQLFEDYVQRNEELEAQYPELAIVHFTMPLTSAPDGWKEQVKTLLGRNTRTRLNMVRGRFNELMRERYGDSGLLFDIAHLESTRADGSRAYSSYFGRRVEAMAAEWTTDGGHLNAEAEDRVAEALLVFLARVATSTDNNREIGDVAVSNEASETR